MTNVKSTFLPLHHRLHSFTTVVEYERFAYVALIKGLEKGIFENHNKQAINEIDRYLKWTDSLLKEHTDFSKCYKRYEYIEVDNPDEYSVLPPVITYRGELPFSNAESEYIHRQVTEELRAYQLALEKYRAVLNSFYIKEEAPKALFLFDYKDKQKLLYHLRGALVDDLFLMGSKNSAMEDNTFERIFAGEKPPENKFCWTGTLETLCYFIKGLSKRKLIKNENKWDSTRACFYIEGKSLDNLDVQGKPSKVIAQKLDTLLDGFYELIHRKEL